MNTTTSHVLIIEDDRDGRRSVAEAVEDLGLASITAATATEGVEQFKTQPVDCVLSDLMLPDFNGIEVVTRIRRLNPDVPILIMTAYGTIDSAVEAMKAGAYDYLTKPLDLDDLQAKIRRALETRLLRRQVATLQDTVRSRYSARNSMIAGSPAMQDVIHQIEAVAPADVTVLVHGESGTGKELVARALHADGSRRDGPFVAVNCGAFTESLLDSELFGHEKGAFTGATQQHKGAFERAHGGTLFLDEIGNAPPPVQIKLLRVLEERELLRVGGQQPVKVDVRLVSASNQDLQDLVSEGSFREDLLYRLKVVTINLPPLRERRDDIPALADRFIALACQDHGRQISQVTPDFYQALQVADWPGNVRQLRNVVEVSVLMASGPTLSAAALQLGPTRPAAVPAAGFVVPDNMTLAQLEKEILSQVLGRNEGNRTLTAEKLDISRRTIQRKIKEHDLPF